MTEPQPLQERVDIPTELAEAVDLLVSEHGVEDAEAQLQEQFKRQEDRAIAALAYLRRKYGGDGA